MSANVAGLAFQPQCSRLPIQLRILSAGSARPAPLDHTPVHETVLCPHESDLTHGQSILGSAKRGATMLYLLNLMWRHLARRMLAGMRLAVVRH